MDSAFGLMVAFQQVAWLVGGLFFWFIAGVMILSFLYDRKTKKTYSGHIVALRVSGDVAKGKGVFYPVVSYRDENGAVVEAETRHGSSGLAGKIPGRAVRVMPDVHDGHIATIRNGSDFILIAVMMVVGAMPIAIGVTQYAMTPYTILMFGLFGAWMGWKFLRLMRPRGERQGRDEFRRRKGDELLASHRAMPRLERDEAIAQLKNMDTMAFRFLPISAIIAIIFLGVGGWIAHDSGVLMRTGLQAEGRVVGLDKQNGSDSYHAIVEYYTADQEKIRFTEKSGSSAPSVSTGQAVQVMYDPDKPKRAMIRESISLVWILIGGAVFSGGFVLIMGICTLFGVLGRRAKGYVFP